MRGREREDEVSVLFGPWDSAMQESETSSRLQITLVNKYPSVLKLV
jgi:hypothetical protein